MAQCRLKGVLFALAGEVIAARTKVSCSEGDALRKFPIQVEVIFERVWELRVVGHCKKVNRLGQNGILWI